MLPGFKSIPLLVLLLILSTGMGVASDPQREDAISVVADYTYQPGDHDSVQKSRALALFGAKLKAVHLAAKYLTHKGLLEHYEKKQGEIFCLATNEIEVTIIEEKSGDPKEPFYFKISSEISILDFIRAQIKDLEFEKKEAGFPYSKEMRQPVLKIIDPGQELSRAYRYIRQQEWRIAIIYLDHLEKKYPSWGDLYLAKAIAFYGINAKQNMVDALHRACSLNNQEACDELQSFPSDAP